MIRLPAIFSDGMVITKEARVWGWAKPGTAITANFMCKQYEATATEDGRFQFTIISAEYGGPHELTVGDKTISDVYIGKVWLCGGQSNMEQPLARTRPLLNAHIKDNPKIRAFHVEKGLRFDGPATDAVGNWQTATGEFLDSTFAVPYFFAQSLDFGKTPIGLINIASGGTPAEAWLPEDIIRTYPDLYMKLEPYKQQGFAESQGKNETDRLQDWHNIMQSKDMGLAEGWYLPEYNHSHWEEKMLLDKNGRPEYGAVWYRKDISVPDNITGPITLSLGRVAERVQAYVNGELVAAINYQYPPCRCVVPEGLIKAGINTIAVRVVGASEKPFFVPGARYELTHKNGNISLLGPWKRRQGCTMSYIQPMIWPYRIPAGSYNYMLAPVLGYDVDGVIWYQGETNAPNPQGYKALFGAFISHIRKYYRGDLPVIFTQLPNYVDLTNATGENWAQLRDEQRQCLEIPGTAMAVTIDCGEWNDIHPQDKKTVGERLALCAKRLAYGEDVVCSGPVANEVVIYNGEMKIYFDNGVGLWAKNGRPVVEVLDSKETVHHFYAKTECETLTAQIGTIDAQRVRFGWADCPTVVLYNAYGLPASPFNIPV